MNTCNPVLPTSMTTSYSFTKNSGVVISNVFIIGALQYVTLTRLEIEFSANKLSQFLLVPIDDHW